MTFCHYQESISPHMMPLMRALVARLGEDEVRYVYAQDLEAERRALGWSDASKPLWTLDARREPDKARLWLESCPCLMSGCRDIDLFERRARKNLLTFYSGERWFKPIPFFRGYFDLPGCFRLFSPRYFHMASRMRRLLCGDGAFYYLPDGVLAARDMVCVLKWLAGNMMPLDVVCSRVPGGRVLNCGKMIEHIRLWGYFVEPSMQKKVYSRSASDASILKILWVGRMVDWKRVDTIVRAVRYLQRKSVGDVTATIVGNGPERLRLENFAKGGPVRFMDSVPISEVRAIMRKHDVYVLPSDGGEGWGAAVNEALEEGMYVLGTYEAGSSATMLDERDLFHAGDWNRLQVLLERCLDEKRRGTLKGQGIGEWSAEKAADRLMTLINDVRK